MTKTIILSKGYTSIIDDEDFDRLGSIRWHATVKRNKAYAESATVGKMHRFILMVSDDCQVDHINGDTLDNRKSNLRICTPAQNARNRKTPITNKTGFKGLWFNRKRNKWQVHIKVSGTNKHIGYFDTKTEAAKAYNDAAVKYHGEFARLNDLGD